MWSKINQLTLLNQSLFGLPWILTAVLLVFENQGLPTDLLFWSLFFAAFFSARILGMSLNRMIDCAIDGKNPRTQNRPLQLKIISRKEVKGIILFSTFLFVTSCYFLNTLCFFFSPIVLFQLYVYSFAKRISSLCHFFLGSIHFMGPIFAWMALTDSLDARPLLLGLALWLFIAGNDVVYAIQDIDFDRSFQLRSIPAWLGERRALILAKICHALAFASLFTLGFIAQLDFWYDIGVLSLIMLYLYSYQCSPLHCFTRCNMLSGLFLLTFTSISILWPHLF